MNPKTKAALMSGLVFPGLGQVFNKQKAKGAVMIASVSVFFVWLTVRIFRLTWKTIAVTGADGLESMRMDPESIARLHNQAWALNWWLAAIIMAIWAYSIIDAYYLGGEKPAGATPEK